MDKTVIQIKKKPFTSYKDKTNNTVHFVQKKKIRVYMFIGLSYYRRSIGIKI